MILFLGISHRKSNIILKKNILNKNKNQRFLVTWQFCQRMLRRVKNTSFGPLLVSLTIWITATIHICHSNSQFRRFQKGFLRNMNDYIQIIWIIVLSSLLLYSFIVARRIHWIAVCEHCFPIYLLKKIG